MWSLDRFRAWLGEAAFRKLWAQIQRSVALTFVSALPRAQEVQAQMALPPRSCFQVCWDERGEEGWRGRGRGREGEGGSAWL